MRIFQVAGFKHHFKLSLFDEEAERCKIGIQTCCLPGIEGPASKRLGLSDPCLWPYRPTTWALQLLKS